MSNDIDYSKSCIQFDFGEMTYYSLWGSDTEQDHDDKFLTLNDKILLFEDQVELKTYVLTTPNLFFDKTNIKHWIKSIDTIEVIYSFNLDLVFNRLANSKSVFLTKEVSNEFVDLLNLIGDYAYQIEDTELIRLFKHGVVQEYWDYAYNNFFWNKATETKSTFEQADELKSLLDTIKELLSTKFAFNKC